MEPQYWVVGAMFGGVEDAFSDFVINDYWYCWDPKTHDKIPDAVAEYFPKIKRGDRIAIKKMLGQGSPSIQIRALGIVTAVDYDEWRVYVNWLITDLKREVPIKNYMSSLHPPVEPSEWRSKVFCI